MSGSAAARAHVLQLLGGKWLAAATSAAAELGLPALLDAGPRSLDDLAEALEADAAALQRLLGVLVGAELLEVDAAGRFGLTAAGRVLGEDALGPLARFIAADFNWAPWSALAESVRTGRSAFSLHHGQGLFDLLDDDAEAAATYHEAIDAFVAREAAAVVEAFDFSGVERVVDVGGGRGALLLRLLQRWPDVRGELLERPAVAEQARRRFEDAGLADRVAVRTGDFFDTLPKGADVYVLKHVLHCLDDDTARALLRRCAEAAADACTILVVEGLKLPAGRLDQTGLMDLEMLVLLGQGRERSKPEMRRLLQSAGLRLVRSPALEGGARLIVAERDAAGS